MLCNTGCCHNHHFMLANPNYSYLVVYNEVAVSYQVFFLLKSPLVSVKWQYPVKWLKGRPIYYNLSQIVHLSFNIHFIVDSLFSIQVYFQSMSTYEAMA